MELTRDSIKIKDVDASGLVENKGERLQAFLKQNKLVLDDIGAVYYSCSNDNSQAQIDQLFKKRTSTDIHKYCKNYLTNSSFALHLAIDEMHYENHKYSLIC